MLALAAIWRRSVGEKRGVELLDRLKSIDDFAGDEDFRLEDGREVSLIFGVGLNKLAMQKLDISKECI